MSYINRQFQRLTNRHRISLYDIFAGAAPFAVIMLLVLIAFPQLSLMLV